VQALADLVLVVESTMRRWQVGVNQQLAGRMEHMLGVNAIARRAFDAAHHAFVAQYPNQPDREEAAAVNWAIDNCLGRFAAARTVAERAGISCYLTVRLRNSLSHVIDHTVKFVY